MQNADSQADFFAAVRANDLAKVSQMLRQHPDLARARCAGDARLLGVVWNRNSSHDPVSPDDPRSSTALHYAAHNGYAALVKLLLTHGADPNSIGYDNNRNNVTPLILAAAEGDLETISHLLDHRADPNFKTNAGITALSTALDEKSLDKAQLLIACGAIPDIFDAIKLGQTDRVRELLRLDAAIARQPNRKGETPLDVAVEWGRRDVTESLLANGVKLTPKAAAGFGMLDELRAFLDDNPHLISNANLLTIAAINGAVASIDLLLSRGADPNEFDHDRAQPLHNVAMSMVRPACAKSVAPLIKAGTNATSVHRGHTPLQRARAVNNDPVIQALLDQGITH